MRTLICNGTLVTPSGLIEGDLLVEDEKIAQVGPQPSTANPDRILDASGYYVLPGGVDPHVHLALRIREGVVSSDDFETGTRAAAFGGTTTVIDFAAQPKGGSLQEGLEERLRDADGKAAIDYAFHMTLREVRSEVVAELDVLVREGVPSFKLFTAYPGRYQLDDGAILRVLQRSAENGGLVLVHAENGPAIEVLVEQALARGETAAKFHALTRPARLEAEAVGRCLALAEIAGAPLYVVHLSSREALEPLRAARARGQAVWAETCPQYLLLSQRDIEAPGLEAAKLVFSPPVRAPGNEEHLWRALASGELSVVATDHCPFFVAQKALGRERFTDIPNGVPGIETRSMLLWDEGVRSGRIDVARFVDLTATAPARLFGLYPTKGALVPGADADIVLWNPEREKLLSPSTLHMRTDYCPYDGRRVKGVPEQVFSRGEVIVDGDRWLGRPGHGRFVKRGPRQPARQADTHFR